jgi:DNA modification methylase
LIKEELPVNQVIQGDALQILKDLPEQSIDCCFTCPNPPFYERKQINNNIIGSEVTSNEYIDHLVAIFNEVFRVIKTTGCLFVVMADYHQQGTLTMIPEMFALRMIQNGWYLRSKIIWHRTEKSEQEDTNRFRRDWEYIFFFTKIPDGYYFNNKNKYHKTSLFAFPSTETSNEFSSGFPEEIIRVAITTALPPNGIIMDIFACTGTTGVVAKKMKKKYIMIDVNLQLCEMMNTRLSLIK